MSMDQYSLILTDLASLKDEFNYIQEQLHSIQNNVNLILTYTRKQAMALPSKNSAKTLVEQLPNDETLDAFENIEGTYKDYSKVSNDDTLSKIELETFRNSKHADVSNQPTNDAHKNVQEIVQQTLSSVADQITKLFTDSELDNKDAEDFIKYKAMQALSNKELYNQTFKQWKKLPTEEQLNKLDAVYDNMVNDAKAETVETKKSIFENLPNDKVLDELEHSEGTYKDYAINENDTLSKDEIVAYHKGYKDTAYSNAADESQPVDIL